MPYELALAQMRARVAERTDHDGLDEIWILEHPPIFTLGQAGKPEHLLNPGKIPVHRVERGGQVTYHGPGQAVIYPLLSLRRFNLNVRRYVCLLEQTAIDVLAKHGIAAQTQAGAPGVYLAAAQGHLVGAKIAALGIKISRGVAWHGLSLNVSMDLSPFQAINPCGYPGLTVTDMREALAASSASPNGAASLPTVSTIQYELGHTLAQHLSALEHS
jgi:lipoyl(octanoyl) transferase